MERPRHAAHAGRRAPRRLGLRRRACGARGAGAHRRHRHREAARPRHPARGGRMTRSRRVTAFPHQIEGTDFIASRPATALFDEQGLGKTKQLIDAVAREVEAGTLAGALIVCPNTLKSTWAREIERHSTLPYAVFGAGK